MKNIILKYYFKITAIGIFSAFLVGCSGLKVMIETEQPEDDFVVQCIWSSSGFKMHGGRAIVHSDAFVASSGEITDCGVLWYGVGPRVQVSHPLYISDKKYEKNIYNSDGEIIDTIVIYKMQLKEKYLDELIRKFKGSDLKRAVVGLGGSRISYLAKYDKVKKMDVEYFKKKYNKRLINFWKKLLPIIKEDWIRGGVESDLLTPEKIVNRQWGKNHNYSEWREDDE